MASSVTFASDKGGDGSTLTDDSNPSTGIRDGGHRLRFIPALSNFVSMLSWFVTLISGYPKFRGSGTWTALQALTGNTVGDLYLVTNVGPTGWIARWDGTRWRATAPIDIGSAAITTGVAGTAAQTLFNTSVPPALLLAFRRIRITMGFTKSGNVNAVSTSEMRLGSTNNPALDVILRNVLILTAANRSAGAIYDFGILSPTSILPLGCATNQGSPTAGNALAALPAVTVDDMSVNTMYFTYRLAMSASSDVPGTNGVSIELIP